MIKVGDPDPTNVLDGLCCDEQKEGRFRCTLAPGHVYPQHIAGDGFTVCAVWPVR